MIFATVGSTQIRFDRFTRALAALPAEQLFVQHGPMAAPAGAAQAVAYMQFPEVVESMERADTVVCHAGAGSILCALRAGHVPVVVPRLKRFQETVDDHQVEFSRALAAQGKVIAVEDPEQLAAAVAAAPKRRPPQEQNALRPIQVAVREALHGPAA
ncbi:MAG TPA: glycosyltransferase [Solirubrobacterales bacterium]|nr:glycosyltransferase [Solirubrobacterales bacterium]